jgi:hypothetical protein
MRFRVFCVLRGKEKRQEKKIGDVKVGRFFPVRFSFGCSESRASGGTDLCWMARQGVKR